MLQDVNPLLALAVLLLGGLLGGYLARLARLPHVIGQIAVGVALGPSLLDLFTPGTLTSLGTFTQFALGFIALTVGEHLDLRALRNAGKRLALLLLAESLITPTLVIAATLPLVASPWAPILLGTMAISTAPATVLALVKESRSRGVFVKTLIAAVALNNISCIVLFSIARTAADAGLVAGSGPGAVAALGAGLLASAATIGASLLLGAGSGAVLVLLMRHEVRGSHLAAASVVALLLVCGLADLFGLPVLLACLATGVAIANLRAPERHIGVSTLESLETAIFALFFTIAGMELELRSFAAAGILALLVVSARFAGKIVSANLGMRLARATVRIRRYLGFALIPQAGVAVGLIIQVRQDPRLQPVHALILAVGLASVVANELIGSLTAHLALRKSGEVGRDRPRLMDFIEEPQILTGLTAQNKEEVITRLADHLLRTHRLKMDREAFLASILRREAQASTCVGHGLAIPHGIIEGGKTLMGVMGLSRQGLAFETPDDQPVRCVVLLATPEAERERHLQVMASLARMVSRNPGIAAELFDAETPAHAHDVLHAEESEDFNYYLTQ